MLSACLMAVSGMEKENILKAITMNSKSDQNELEINQKNSKNRQNTEALPKKKRKVVDN